MSRRVTSLPEKCPETEQFQVRAEFCIWVHILYEDGWVGGFIELGGGFVYAEKLAVDQALDFLADFVGITMGMELLLDVGAFDPFPAEFLHFGLRAGFFQGEALLLDGEALGVKVAAAEGGDPWLKVEG
jgi:hypothetical protein